MSTSKMSTMPSFAIDHPNYESIRATKPIQYELNHGLPEITHHRKRQRPEAKIQKAIIQWLQAHGAVAIRVNSGMVEKEYSGRRRRFKMNSVSGCSDLICCVPSNLPHFPPGYPSSMFVAIEVKSGSNRPSEKQSHFLEQIRNAGGIAFVARSIADLEKNLPWLL